MYLPLAVILRPGRCWGGVSRSITRSRVWSAVGDGAASEVKGNGTLEGHHFRGLIGSTRRGLLAILARQHLAVFGVQKDSVSFAHVTAGNAGSEFPNPDGAR